MYIFVGVVAVVAAALMVAVVVESADTRRTVEDIRDDMFEMRRGHVRESRRIVFLEGDVARLREDFDSLVGTTCHVLNSADQRSIEAMGTALADQFAELGGRIESLEQGTISDKP